MAISETIRAPRTDSSASRFCGGTWAVAASMSVRFRGRVGRKEIRPSADPVLIEPQASRRRGRRTRKHGIRCSAMDAIEIETPHGPARADLDPADDPAGTLVLGHGAGGGVEAADIQAAAAVAREAGFSVILVEQPYRVAGRKAPAPAKQLDAAWEAVVAELRERGLATAPLVAGG